MKLHNKKDGFTLMELLIVMAILIVIMAIALPLVMNQWNQANEREAATQIGIFGPALESYKLDRGTYPTTQQGGLLCLIGKGMVVAPSATTTPGTLGTTPLSGDGFGGAAPVGFGPGAGDPNGGFGAPNGFDGGVPPMGTDGMPIDGASPSTFGAPAAIPGTVGTDGATATTFGAGGAAVPGSTVGTGIQGAGTGKTYLDYIELPKDPWGESYYYEYPTNKTVDGKPAIWSAGKDKISGTDDDIISWKKDLDDIMKDPQKFEQYKQRQSQPLPGQAGSTIPGQPNNNLPGQNGMFPNTPDPMFPGANDPNGGFPAGPTGPSGFPGEDINQPFPPMDNGGGAGGFTDPLPPM